MSDETVPKRQDTEKRQVTEECRQKAVRLAKSLGGHETARRLSIPIATLSNWSRRRRETPGKETIESAPSVHAWRSSTDPEAENGRLRKELASAGLDDGILRKATAYCVKGAR